MARTGSKRAKRPEPRPSSGLYSFLVLGAAAAGLLWLILSTASPDAAMAGCPAGADCITIHTDTGAHVFTVEWAIDPAEMSCGLMFRETMEADHGMVFDYRADRPLVAFWMRNTLIPLDMIFIRENGAVLNIAERTTPLSLATVPATGPVRYVLEVVGGTADRIGLDPGDLVDLERRPGMTEGTAVCFPAI